jgi:hypothetical protein
MDGNGNETGNHGNNDANAHFTPPAQAVSIQAQLDTMQQLMTQQMQLMQMQMQNTTNSASASLQQQQQHLLRHELLHSIKLGLYTHRLSRGSKMSVRIIVPVVTCFVSVTIHVFEWI